MLGKKRRKTKKLRDGKSSLGWVEGPREGRRSGSMRGVRLQKRVNYRESKWWSEGDVSEIEVELLMITAPKDEHES